MDGPGDSAVRQLSPEAERLRFVRRWLRYTFIALCVICFGLLPFIAWWAATRFTYPEIAWFIAGFFCCVTIPVSIYPIARHMQNFSNPELQRHVIRLLWMVPIYSVNCWLSLRFKAASVYIDSVRDCYEAVVLYSFYQFMLSFIAQQADPVATHAAKPPMHHVIGMQWFLPKWTNGARFLLNCKLGVWAYVVFKPLEAVVAVVTEALGLYGGSLSSLVTSYPYLVIVTTAVQMWALYILVLFYHEMYDELAPINPLYKFIVVKSIVFFSFWQSVVIAVLVYFNLIKPSDKFIAYSADDLAEGIQNFVLCIELFFIAIAHVYTFPVRDFKATPAEERSSWAIFWDMLSVNDLAEDLAAVAKGSAVGRAIPAPGGSSTGQAKAKVGKEKHIDMVVWMPSPEGKPGAGKAKKGGKKGAKRAADGADDAAPADIVFTFADAGQNAADEDNGLESRRRQAPATARPKPARPGRAVPGGDDDDAASEALEVAWAMGGARGGLDPGGLTRGMLRANNTTGGGRLQRGGSTVGGLVLGRSRTGGGVDEDDDDGESTAPLPVTAATNDGLKPSKAPAGARRPSVPAPVARDKTAADGTRPRDSSGAGARVKAPPSPSPSSPSGSTGSSLQIGDDDFWGGRAGGAEDVVEPEASVPTVNRGGGPGGKKKEETKRTKAAVPPKPDDDDDDGLEIDIEFVPVAPPVAAASDADARPTHGKKGTKAAAKPGVGSSPSASETSKASKGWNWPAADGEEMHERAAAAARKRFTAKGGAPLLSPLPRSFPPPPMDGGDFEGAEMEPEEGAKATAGRRLDWGASGDEDGGGKGRGKPVAKLKKKGKKANGADADEIVFTFD